MSCPVFLPCSSEPSSAHAARSDVQDLRPERQQSVGRQMIKVQSLRRIGEEEEEENVEEEGTDFQKNERGS